MKTKRAGALLFAIITAFVLTLVVSTIVILTTNQFRIIDNEVDRIIAFYRTQAAMEYAIWWAYTNPGSLPAAVGANVTIADDLAIGNGTVDITITRINPASPAPFANLSNYGIQITTNY